MSGHTPGPWKVTPRFQDKVDIIHPSNAIGAATKCICRVNVRISWLEEQEANARLIAAAPELLDALRKVSSFWGSISSDAQPINDLHELVIRVVAKATGQ